MSHQHTLVHPPVHALTVAPPHPTGCRGQPQSGRRLQQPAAGQLSMKGSKRRYPVAKITVTWTPQEDQALIRYAAGRGLQSAARSSHRHDDASCQCCKHSLSTLRLVCCRLVNKHGEGNWSTISRDLNAMFDRDEAHGRIGKQVSGLAGERAAASSGQLSSG
jgi:hypothetical protein